jgi:hypothetical protein
LRLVSKYLDFPSLLHKKMLFKKFTNGKYKNMEMIIKLFQ